MRARPRLSQIWALSFFTICYICLCEAQAGSSNNVSISNTSPQIRYTPFLCPTTAETCDGAWRVTDVDGASVVSTNGPTDAENDILPQMFFSFRASTIFVQTSSLSNATVNLTIFAGNVGVTAVINSSLGNFTVVQLPEDEVATLSLTFIAWTLETSSSRSQIRRAGNSATSSFLPTQTLPPPIILPSFVPPSRAQPSATASSLSTSTTIPSLSLKYLVVLAVGLVVGLGLGLTVLVAALWLLWRRRRIKAASQFTLSSALTVVKTGNSYGSEGFMDNGCNSSLLCSTQA
ncbi:hypothetical protein C8J56DRAFT_800330 [Mycena floridula]|nr:hypothetical protein C8J56DRAFT_800330 [Mycena floridula]